MSRLFYARKKLQFILRPIYDQIYETPRPSCLRLADRAGGNLKKGNNWNMMIGLHYREIFGPAAYILCIFPFSTPDRSAPGPSPIAFSSESTEQVQWETVPLPRRDSRKTRKSPNWLRRAKAKARTKREGSRHTKVRCSLVIATLL
jgi:hypothetical protein